MTFRFWNLGRRELWILLPAVVVFGSLLIFAKISGEVRENEWHASETGIMRSLRTVEDPSIPIGPKWMQHSALDISALGGGSVLTLMTLLVLGYLLLLRRYHAVLLVLVATVGGMLLNNSLKQFFGRERPSIVPHLSEVASASYPSGHSMLSAIVYLTLGVMLAQSTSSWRLRMYFVGSALLVTFLIGLTRVYLGVHYPTDVLGGWTVGTAYAVLCAMTANWLQRRGKVESPER